MPVIPLIMTALIPGEITKLYSRLENPGLTRAVKKQDDISASARKNTPNFQVGLYSNPEGRVTIDIFQKARPLIMPVCYDRDIKNTESIFFTGKEKSWKNILI